MTHNIPLLRDVLGHPRFKAGKLSTKFLAEEYPHGFIGHQLIEGGSELELLALSGLIHAKRNKRRRQWVEGGGSLPVGHLHRKEWEIWVVIDEREARRVHILQNDETFEITVDNGHGKSWRLDVEAEWQLESPLLKSKISGLENVNGSKEVVVQYLESLPLGFQLSHYGTKVCYLFIFSRITP